MQTTFRRLSQNECSCHLVSLIKSELGEKREGSRVCCFSIWLNKGWYVSAVCLGQVPLLRSGHGDLNAA